MDPSIQGLRTPADSPVSFLIARTKDMKQQEATIESVKRDAKAIARATSVTHSQALDVLAVQAGYSHWGAYQTVLLECEAQERARIARTVPPIDLIRALIPDIAHLDPRIERARHLIVSGGTSTGKTTLLRRLIDLVPAHAPIALLQEMGELVNPNPVQGLVVEDETLRRLGYEAYVLSREAAKRNGAGVLVYDEISTRNAVDAFYAFQDPRGPTVLTTIHASSPDQARVVFGERIGSRSIGALYVPDVVCIQMRRDLQGKRVVSEIVTF